MSRVICKCGQKAIIQSTNRISCDYAELYCSCSDPECGHTFVTKQMYSHSLSPSAKSARTIISELVSLLPDKERKELQQELNFN